MKHLRFHGYTVSDNIHILDREDKQRERGVKESVWFKAEQTVPEDRGVLTSLHLQTPVSCKRNKLHSAV
ncbi:Uncharacterized protein DAT39_001914 [Clarias magur]|uniref:Uncharacterized protein n=1 Tax=Clarias magur TaxID=1594786 RepID=A0A8J4U9Y5_CLAMG|nr:Uncharacterized protein DAT39_001914 [Clarias magur]